MSQRIPLPESKLKELQHEIEPIAKGFDSSADHAIITDEHANILYANNAVEEKTGFTKEEVIGKNPGDLWGGNMPYEFYKEMWRAIKVLKVPFVGEVHNKKKDGTWYWQEVHISPILDDARNVRFYVGVEPDITLRKSTEKELVDQYEMTMRLRKIVENRELNMSDLEKEMRELKKKIGTS